jgi:hypothetical protein
MYRIKSITNSLGGRAAMAGGAFFAADGVLQIVHSQRDTGSKVVGLAGHLNLAFFILALILVAPAFVALARYARPGVIQKVALAVAGATTLLGLTSITSLVLGHDGVWFNVIAPLTNAVWLFGSIAMAVSLKRAGRVPALVAIGLPIAWIGTIPLATLGGGLITGAYFLAVGYLLLNEAIARVRPVAQAARA